MTEERKRALERELKRLTTSLGRISEEIGLPVSIYADGKNYKQADIFPYDGCVARSYANIDGILSATKAEAWSYMPEGKKEALREKYGKEGDANDGDIRTVTKG